MNDEPGAAFAVGWSGITSDEWRTWRDCRSRQAPNSAAAAISAKTRLGQGAVVNRVCFIRVKITKQLQKRFEPLVLPSGRGEQVPLDPFSLEPFEVASALPSRSRIHCRLRYQVSVSHSALTTAHQEKFIRALSQQLTCPEKGRGFTWALEKLTRWLRVTTKLNFGTAAKVA